MSQIEFFEADSKILDISKEIRAIRKEAKEKILEKTESIDKMIKAHNEQRAEKLWDIWFEDFLKGKKSCQDCGSDMELDEQFLLKIETGRTDIPSKDRNNKIVRVCRDCSIALLARDGTYSLYDDINKIQTVFHCDEITNSQRLKKRIIHFENNIYVSRFLCSILPAKIGRRENFVYATMGGKEVKIADLKEE